MIARHLEDVASGSLRVVVDRTYPLSEGGGDNIGDSFEREVPLGLVAALDQDCAAARPPAGLDVVQDIADEPGAGEVEMVIARGAEDETGAWLAAVAVEGVAGDGAGGMMEAE